MKTCKNCLYFGSCNDNTVCEYFVSIHEEANECDSDVDKNDALDFYREWYKYIADNGDDLYAPHLYCLGDQ